MVCKWKWHQDYAQQQRYTSHSSRIQQDVFNTAFSLPVHASHRLNLLVFGMRCATLVRKTHIVFTARLPFYGIYETKGNVAYDFHTSKTAFHTSWCNPRKSRTNAWIVQQLFVPKWVYSIRQLSFCVCHDRSISSIDSLCRCTVVESSMLCSFYLTSIFP